jgi:cell division septum initiation protein DivIVA
MSKIEQIITEIEEYIESCKKVPFSTNNIVVNKDEMQELLAELRLKTPDEIKKYQKIITNREAILTEARERAESMIAQATAHTTELISEHEIMQQAYAQANEVLQNATNQARDILDAATTEANELRLGAMAYVDEILGNVQNAISYQMQDITIKYDNYIKSLNSSLEVVIANRKELNPSDEINEDLLPDAVPTEEEDNITIDDTEIEDYTVDFDSL